MGQVWAQAPAPLRQVCEPKVSGEVEVVDHPDHPGASRVPYALMQGYYGSVCKIVKGGESFGTGWLIRLADLGPGIAKGLQDPQDQAIVCARAGCVPTKESAGSFEAMFDYVDDSAPGLRIPLDPKKFFFSGGGKGDYVVCGLRDNQADRKPLKLGTLTDAQLPPQATITVVAHPVERKPGQPAQGLPREVSHGHITRVDQNWVYYNAGAKAAMGSAVFFAFNKDLHVIAMGLKGAEATEGDAKGAHEVMGVRVSRFSEVFWEESVSPGVTPAKPASPEKAPAAAPAAPTPTGPTRIEDADKAKVKLYNGQTVTYTGKLKLPSNVPHGTGTASYDNGVTYEGEWNNGKRHGPGKITKVKEGYYSKGECEDDLFIGTWTKYSIKGDEVLEEQHYDHSTMDSVRRHLGFSSRKARPKEESQSPTKEGAGSPAKSEK